VTLNGRLTVTAAVAVVLASIDLYPLFTNSAWFVASIGAVAAVAATGALTRLRSLPVPACAAATIAGLLLYLNLVFEARHSLLFVIPAPASVSRLWHLAGTGLYYANKDGSPAPNLPGLLLLAAAGVGITAVLTDLIAVRLRSAALAGLPLLVLFTVPVMMTTHGQTTTPLVFCLGGAGYLAMLSADGRERIRVWGRLVSLWRGGSDRARRLEPGPDTRALASASRRVGLASIALALFAPLLVPGLHPGKLFSSGAGTGGTSPGTAVGFPDLLSQTIAELRKPASVVLRYTTNAPAHLQADDPQYLRQYVFDTLTDASGWGASGYQAGAVQIGAIPPEPGLTRSASVQAVTTRVQAGPDLTGSGPWPVFLPMPSPPTQLTTPAGIWMVDPDLMVYSGGGDIANQAYSVRSLAVDPTAAQLNQAPPPSVTVSADVRLPSSYRRPPLERLADTITANQDTEYAKADALATWLRDEGTYDVAAPAFHSAAGLLTFLTTPRGSCVQFAWAMTVLARLLGIPARVAAGFTAGTPTSRDHYEVTSKDDHAWTEVYFQGYGWLRFEPTPAGQGTANTPNYMTGGKTGGGKPGFPVVLPSPGAAATPATSKPPHPSQNGITGPGSNGAITTVSGKSAGTPWAAIALAVIAAIALACGVIAVVAPPAHRTRSHTTGAARRPRAVTATSAVLVAATAALVALAMYRLTSRASGLDLGARWETVGTAFGAAAGVALVTPACLRVALRRWRWLHATDDVSRAHAAWREFHDDLADFGVSYRPSEPPRTLAGRVTAGLPEPAAEAVRRLALAEERASYAARPSESQNLLRDGASARLGLAASARRGTRWRARVFPASLLTALADGAARLPGDVTALVSRRHVSGRRAEHRSAS
jgi:hypothetical protein